MIHLIKSSLTAVLTLAYVTYQDIRSISSFEEQTVIAIKAPPETRLEVPDPTDVSFVYGVSKYYSLKSLSNNTSQ